MRRSEGMEKTIIIDSRDDGQIFVTIERIVIHFKATKKDVTANDIFDGIKGYALSKKYRIEKITFDEAIDSTGCLDLFEGATVYYVPQEK